MLLSAQRTVILPTFPSQYADAFCERAFIETPFPSVAQLSSHF